jgi:hypothetical protein
MSWLAENSLAIWMIGAIALTFSVIVYYQRRTLGSLIGVAGVIVVTVLLLLVSWLIETPREAVERSLYQLAATVEANDVKGALSFIAPSAAAQLRKDVNELMPLVKIERARVIGSPEIEVESGPNPKTATVRCQGIIVAVNKRDGLKGGANDRLKMTWVRQGDRWLIESYESDKNWNRALGK